MVSFALGKELDWLVATLRLETKKKQNVSPVWPVNG